MKRRGFLARLIGLIPAALLASEPSYYDRWKDQAAPAPEDNLLRFPSWVQKGDIVLDLNTLERCYVTGTPYHVGSSRFRFCPVMRGFGGGSSAKSWQRGNLCAVIGTAYTSEQRIIPTKTGPKAFSATQLFNLSFTYI